MLHSLANDWIFSTELWPTETKNRLNSSATVLLSLLKIRWDLDFLGIIWRIAFQILFVLPGFL